MPDLPAYTRDELVERARNLLRTRRRGIDLTRFSDWDLWAHILGALAWAEQKRAEGLLLLLDPRRAYGAFLETFAADAGVGRDLTEVSTAATYAKGQVILLATPGSPALVQPAGTVLRHRDGTEYTLDANATTSAVANKTLYAGHLSTRRRIYQGHLGGGATSTAPGEIYLASATAELCAVKSADNRIDLTRYLVDWFNPLDRDPALHDTFAQKQGVVASVTAKKPGRHGNKEPKDRLTVVSPTSGVLAEAYVVTLDGGADAMTPAELQAAIGSVTRERAPVGTLEDVRKVALRCPGVSLGECFVAPALDGIATYALLPVHSEGGYVGAADRTALAEHVAARFSPVDRFSAVSLYEAVDTRIDVLNVQVAENYKPDWQLPDESDIGALITGSTIDTVTVDVPLALAVGDRVIITERDTSPYLVVRRVTDVMTIGPSEHTLTLDAPLPFPPTAGQAFLTPGGALAESILNTLYGAYAAQAPSTGDGQVRTPSPRTNDEADAVASAVSLLEGVLDVAYRPGPAPDLSTPGGTLVPACVVRMYA